MYTEMCKIIIGLESKLVDLEMLLDRCAEAMNKADEQLKMLNDVGTHWMNTAIELEQEVEALRSQLKNCTGHN